MRRGIRPEASGLEPVDVMGRVWPGVGYLTHRVSLDWLCKEKTLTTLFPSPSSSSLLLSSPNPFFPPCDRSPFLRVHWSSQLVSRATNFSSFLPDPRRRTTISWQIGNIHCIRCRFASVNQPKILCRVRFVRSGSNGAIQAFCADTATHSRHGHADVQPHGSHGEAPLAIRRGEGRGRQTR